MAVARLVDGGATMAFVSAMSVLRFGMRVIGLYILIIMVARD
jgi:hypothetical protein